MTLNNLELTTGDWPFFCVLLRAMGANLIKVIGLELRDQQCEKRSPRRKQKFDQNLETVRDMM